MKNDVEHIFTIGELAKLVGVSVRTLQYYDQKNLLDATYNDSHKRVYTREDLLRILQILFLKSLGMTLQEIDDKLGKCKDSTGILEIFTQQREILLDQIVNLNKIVNTLDFAISEAKSGQEIGLDRLIAIVELMKHGKPVFDKLREFDDRGIDPAGKEAQEFAKQWWSLLSGFADGDASLLKSLALADRDIENLPDEVRYLRKSAEIFLERSIGIYLRNKNQTDTEEHT
ncbi:hypothetical protein YSY43_16810 [Paenibacillus sp. YSY-4.3]